MFGYLFLSILLSVAPSTDAQNTVSCATANVPGRLQIESFTNPYCSGSSYKSDMSDCLPFYSGGYNSARHSCSNGIHYISYYSDSSCSRCTWAIATDVLNLGQCSSAYGSYSYRYTCSTGGGVSPVRSPTLKPTTLVPTRYPTRKPTAPINNCADWINSGGSCSQRTFPYGSARLSKTPCSLSTAASLCCYEKHTITITRTTCNDNGIFGELAVDGSFAMYTLEPVKSDETMALGTFEANYRRMNALSVTSPYLLNSFTGRNWIHIHNGNLKEHTEGCILVGTNRAFMKSGAPYMVTESQKALKKLMSLLEFNAMDSDGSFISDPFAFFPNSLYDKKSRVLRDYPASPLVVTIQNSANYQKCSSSGFRRILQTSDEFVYSPFAVNYFLSSTSYGSFATRLDAASAASGIRSALSLSSSDLLTILPSFYETDNGKIVATVECIFNVSTPVSVLSDAKTMALDIPSMRLTSTSAAIVTSADETCFQCTETEECDSSTYTCVPRRNEDSDDDIVLPIGAVIGIIVGIVILLILCITVIVVQCCLQKQQKTVEPSVTMVITQPQAVKYIEGNNPGYAVNVATTGDTVTL